MQTVSEGQWRQAERIADKRGVTVQQLIRAVIVPEWVFEQKRLTRKIWEANVDRKLHRLGY